MDSYEVMWQRDTSGDCPDADNGSTTLTDGYTSYITTELEEFSNYTITVIAMNAIEMATSNNVTGFTKESGTIKSLLEFCKIGRHVSDLLLTFLSAPSIAPTSVNVSEVTSSSITVQWGAVDCIHRNGDITGYRVQYGVQGNRSTQTKNVSGRVATQTIISGLTPSTNYSIEVAAVNNVGTGVYSNVIYQLTQGTSAQKSVRVHIFISLHLQFKPPSCQFSQHQPPLYPFPGLVLAQ